MIPCESCKASCCKVYDVFIDHQDIKKMFDITSGFSFTKKVKYENQFGYVPKFKLWENNKKNYWVLCLSNPNKVCSFLKNDKCSIYENRPLICKSYPHILVGNKVIEIKNPCPIKWTLTDDKKNQIELDYTQLLLNFLIFQTICDDWNKIVTKEDKLENFLIFVNQYKLN